MPRSATGLVKNSNIDLRGREDTGILTLHLETQTNTRKPLLEPIERVLEVLFGLIMVLTITCSFSIAEADRRSIHTMLLAALGCNLAWGLIDAVFHLIARFSELGRGILALQALRLSADRKEARTIIGDTLPPMLAAALTTQEFDLIRYRLNQIPEPPTRPALVMDDWRAAVGVFLLVFVTTLPVVVPFLLIHDPKVALRASNGVAVLMLFFAGYALGRYSGRRRWLTGLAMVLIGGALVGITIGLGG